MVKLCCQSGPWMKHYQSITEKAPVDMGIYFCCENRLMSKHFLYCPEVGTGFNHMCCKRMPEGMGTDTLTYSRFCGKILCDGKNHGPGELSSPSI